eukprot:TRINITY_DN11356_c0_g1_i1.p1 TRINITY_DN11356_c0_g1~~TRINITY_DN11356_c0_g1_i1.p1  ORF type:complete len:209 (-),score=23.56 TRINITY_DN11356_c0_g1_i1:199-825(-)
MVAELLTPFFQSCINIFCWFFNAWRRNGRHGGRYCPDFQYPDFQCPKKEEKLHNSSLFSTDPRRSSNHPLQGYTTRQPSIKKEMPRNSSLARSLPIQPQNLFRLNYNMLAPNIAFAQFDPFFPILGSRRPSGNGFPTSAGRALINPITQGFHTLSQQQNFDELLHTQANPPSSLPAMAHTDPLTLLSHDAEDEETNNFEGACPKEEAH